VAVYLLDSSAIVKRYVQESGTGWVQGLAHPRVGNLIYLARITAVEVCAAIARRRRAGTIAPPEAAASLARFRLDLAQEYLVLEITASLLADAIVRCSQVCPHSDWRIPPDTLCCIPFETCADDLASVQISETNRHGFGCLQFIGNGPPSGPSRPAQAV
jgi:predicted nucleic acid-binding protein